MSPPVMVRVAHRYSAPAERVFDAWLTPSQASRFLFATRTGNVMQCEINPVVGGGFVVTDRRPLADGDESVFDVVHRGNYVTIERPRLIVFDFLVASYSDETTRVRLDFAAQGANASELTLTHELGDHNEAQAMEDATRKGWAQMLANLERELFPKRVGFL
ncbi:SRPBCC family protein [Caenimonas sedimenti]|nr:SRPBCC domain-containing protein [Caenimonas sedimenti]